MASSIRRRSHFSRYSSLLDILPIIIRWILVSQEHYFKDKYLFYRFSGDENGTLIRPDISVENESDEQLNDVILMLTQVGPDAMLRMILRKP